ncbi:Golgi SNAP receptor complex member 1 isoform X2 [Daktulosphaira vitifoliae]|uniref:Golgi SNAP receptor complex member 1 isoform X2 n=1 Tax=Daktulosphaira vitifoliae TaxID=58002 RepID=UPI0021AAD2F2|nr:Golgi SNAP receptor complex member 1 isoform X2 [Daktulosphaira vitifoliae]
MKFQKMIYFTAILNFDLRKQARRLESEIDSMLVSLSKISTKNPMMYNDDESQMLLSDDRFDTATSEIEELLTKLNIVNDKMEEWNNNKEHISVSQNMHTIQRHRDILQDYTKEFKKIQSTMRARKEREDLLHSVSGYKNSGTKNRRMDLYVKEHEHVRNSDRMISDQISIAIDTREHLISQRHHFKRLQSRLHDLSSRFPALNNLIQKINVKKKRDSLIIAAVVVFFTFIILMYSFH